MRRPDMKQEVARCRWGVVHALELPERVPKALPAPGSEEQLRNLAGRIFSQQLDRTKPLWELRLIEGLDGDRFAVVGKSHHALVDV